MTALESLDLRWNTLVGNIPASLSGLRNLEYLLLSGNRLSGEIPWQLGTLPNLLRLDFSNNNLTGSIPSELGNLANLRALGLHNNDFSGPIPWQLGKAAKLERLILSKNNLTGWVPPELGRLNKLTHLNLSINDMSGPVAPLFDAAVSLESLDLRGSGLTAPAPGEMPRLESVMRRNLADRTQTSREQVRDEEGRTEHDISGTELLAVTTKLVEDAHARRFITRVMRAIQVQDGFLQVNGVDLPAGIDVGQVERAAAAMNAELDKAGQRIGSLNDLERALEVYGQGQIKVPRQAPSTSTRFVENGRSGSVAASFANGQAPTRDVRTHGNTLVPTIVIRCSKLEAQRPHQSRDESQYVKAKFDGTCTDLGSTPFQVFTGTVTLELWQLVIHWFFFDIRIIETAVHERTSPSQPLRWNPASAHVKAPCRNGYYFARAEISFTGSISGNIPWYFPPDTLLPSIFVGTNARFVDCNTYGSQP